MQSEGPIEDQEAFECSLILYRSWGQRHILGLLANQQKEVWASSHFLKSELRSHQIVDSNFYSHLHRLTELGLVEAREQDSRRRNYQYSITKKGMSCFQCLNQRERDLSLNKLHSKPALSSTSHELKLFGYITLIDETIRKNRQVIANFDNELESLQEFANARLSDEIL